MKTDEVVALLGKPTSINSTVTAGGRSEEWVYSEDTLASNLLGYMRANSYEFVKTPMYTSAGIQVKAGRTTSYWYLSFDNGILTTMQQQQ